MFGASFGQKVALYQYKTPPAQNILPPVHAVHSSESYCFRGLFDNLYPSKCFGIFILNSLTFSTHSKLNPQGPKLPTAEFSFSLLPYNRDLLPNLSSEYSCLAIVQIEKTLVDFSEILIHCLNQVEC